MIRSFVVLLVLSFSGCAMNYQCAQEQIPFKKCFPGIDKPVCLDTMVGDGEYYCTPTRSDD